jgi:hypothetical protein
MFRLKFQVCFHRSASECFVETRVRFDELNVGWENEKRN